MQVEKIFIRFGKIPEDGKSLNHLTNEKEIGISVYEGLKENGKFKIVMPSLTSSACVSLSGLILKACGRPDDIFIVEGTVIGKGSDGEPLLANCKITQQINKKDFEMKEIHECL